MNRLESAVDGLVAACGPGGDAEEAADYARAVLEDEADDAAARDRGLARLADAIPAAGLEAAGVAALACGALVERGGDPLRAFDAVLGRLPQALAGAAAFADACRAAAAAAPEGGEGDCVQRFGEAMAAERPDDAAAWEALDLLGMAALAMLTGSPEVRRLARRRPELAARAAAVAGLHERARFLAGALRVLDDEELVVLHPDTGRGWRARIGGIADNFQLHTLLADALAGDPAEGRLPGRRPDPRVAAAARDRPADPAAPLAEGAFSLFGWRALRPDGTLPPAADAAAHGAWADGVPIDFERFEGVRVVLLGPPPSMRTWDAGRRFEEMPAFLRVTETLTPEAARSWLRRIAAPRTPAG
jgi:hypothetical protein